jgi:hypothetical protein
MESKMAAGKNPYNSTPPAVPSVESVVTDRLGTYWLTSGGQLFRSSFGLTRACFASSEPQPFADGRRLTEVLTDQSGGVFLRTSVQGRDEYVFLPARGPLPHTTVKLLENADEGVTLQLAANIPAPRFSWRVDNAPWSEAATNQTVRLEDLAAGKHRVQIVAVDAQLQTDPAPAEVLFETRSNPEQLIQKWITQLGDKDYARREAAIKNLSRHAETALPVLRQARERETDPDRRWWLDAAIQQYE